MAKVMGADSGRSADGTGEVAFSDALDAAFAVYADGQPPTSPLPPGWGKLGGRLEKRLKSYAVAAGVARR